MGGQDNGLTLEGLAKRLESLERENERIRFENAELRHKVATLESSGTRRGAVPALRGSSPRPEIEAGSSESDALVSRRSLLSKAGAAAVAAVAAGAFLHPREAKAHHFTDGDTDAILWEANTLSTHFLDAKSNDGDNAVYADTTSDTLPAVKSLNNGAGPGVVGTNSGTGPAVEGIANGSGGTGVKGTGRYGVWGESNQAGFYGVTGRNTKTDGTGVRGIGAGKGVRGESTNGIGVYGKGKHGLYGESSTAGVGAVEGHNSGGGHGVAAVGRVGLLAFSHENGWIAAWGRHTANGIGVAGDSAQGTGVSGSSTSGYGGQFDGGKAQLRLVPKGTAGKPTTGTHSKGEIYMDSAGALLVCTASGTPGTWRKVTTTAV